jgi:hypothetical protein
VSIFLKEPGPIKGRRKKKREEDTHTDERLEPGGRF